MCVQSVVSGQGSYIIPFSFLPYFLSLYIVKLVDKNSLSLILNFSKNSREASCKKKKSYHSSYKELSLREDEGSCSAT